MEEGSSQQDGGGQRDVHDTQILPPVQEQVSALVTPQDSQKPQQAQGESPPQSVSDVTTEAPLAQAHGEQQEKVPATEQSHNVTLQSAGEREQQPGSAVPSAAAEPARALEGGAAASDTGPGVPQEASPEGAEDQQQGANEGKSENGV